MKHPETYDLFPTLVQKYNIFNDSDIVEDIFSNDDLGNHSLLIESKRSKESYVLDDYPNLKENIQQAVNFYASKIGVSPIIISQSWYNIADNGGYIIRHTHPGSVVSGAYYPFIETGQTYFVVENPHPAEIWEELTKYNEIAHDFELHTDDLLLFPSRMNHSTDPNQSGKRICLSFNTKYIE